MNKYYKRFLWCLIALNTVAVVTGFALRARKLRSEEAASMVAANRYAQGIEDLGELSKAEALEGLRICYRADRDCKISDSDLDKLINFVNEACSRSNTCHPFLMLPQNRMVFLNGSESQRNKAAQLYAKIAHESRNVDTRERALLSISASDLPAKSLIADLVQDPNPRISNYAAKTLSHLKK